ncbi:MAG: hypothetical protein AAB737_04300 [Patescibacteria group bacterium]
MKKLLRASIIVSGLSLVLFFGVGMSVGYAQTANVPPAATPTDTVSQFASKVSILLTKDKARIPNVGFGASTNFTYQGLACFRRTSELSRGGTATYTISCTQQQPKLTATCEDTTGLLNTCRVTDAAGNPVQVGGEDTFSPNRVGEDAVIDAATGQQVGEDTGRPISDDASCSGNFLCALGKLPGMLFAGLGFLLLTLSALILGIAGTVFNWVVIRTVFQFALYFGTSAGMLVAWGVLRDIANIALLFGFIFVGIATILNTQSVEGYTAKKALPRLIIFAVLLNFSLFATQAIIDVANGFSSVFAAYAGQEQCDQGVSTTGSSGQSQAACANLGISSKILEAAGMHNINPFKVGTLTALSQAWEQPYTYTVMLIMLSLMVTVTAMVLIAATIMLVVRVVVLSLLMVTSPIGFAGMAIPSLNKIAQDWWHKLINQAFFAPLFLLMIFVSLKLVEGLQSGEATIADAILGNTGSGGGTTAGNMQVVMVFMIVIGFMIGALMIAQKMGAYGASFATKTAGGIAFGAHGFVARRTVGRVSGKIASKLRGTKFAEGNFGRLVVGAADAGSKASYSTRNLAGGLLKGTGVDVGKANKTAGHGYHGIEEKAEKARLDYAKTLQDRNETDEEYKIRMAALKRDHEQNARDLSKSEAAVPVAEEAKRVVKELLATQESELRRMQTIVTQNPGSAAAQRDLVAAEQNVARTNEDLTQADRNLADATRALASAQETRTKLSKTTTDKITVKGSDRQKAYAENIKHEGDLDFIGLKGIRVTAASHGNHAAAAKILKDANKSDLDKALDALKKEMKAKEKAEAADDHKEETPKTTARGGAAGPTIH